jgi:hypothetical protein
MFYDITISEKENLVLFFKLVELLGSYGAT